jgi:hypothetical protein
VRRVGYIVRAALLVVLTGGCRIGPPAGITSRSTSPPVATPASTLARSGQFELVGQPAIRPTDPDRAAPTFDEADVRAYVTSHADLSVGLRPGPAVVDEIAFLSQRDVRSRFNFGADLRHSDDAVLCVVTVHGLFLRSPDTPEPTLQTLHVVFDGRTGNELLLAGDP